MSKEESKNEIPKLKDFIFEKLLSEDTKAHRVFLLGKFKNSSEPAILKLEKTHFSKENLNNINNYLEKETVLDHNDIYTWLTSNISGTFKDPHLRIQIIYPATSLHIKKYSEQPRVIINETPEQYKNIVLPYIESLPPERTAWVENILEGRQEADSLIYNDKDSETGFIIVPDSKWDRTLNTLYVQCIVHKRGIRSVRDLRREHLPLLRKVYEIATTLVPKIYSTESEKITADQLKIYFHYQPSYYHLHIHITHINVDGVGLYLRDVIDNITMDDQFYAKKTITYQLGKNHILYSLFEKAYNNKRICESIEKEEINKKPKLL
ncbi:scavenger mRNA decapping enzyme [Piromyces finnis]|uniref:Scavenger mRNA decapping enzyme n=1 Tax=Piromyces finnis TaxID=1754191 RepID=A0A1Y1V7I8_9FUNG|nr:scavenger mRNA decapping enzyme [Piromyces finnis]|eukprot:ORX47863.1 scavenger mRNA decapping enzyme [Piromyces finnis]